MYTATQLVEWYLKWRKYKLKLIGMEITLQQREQVIDNNVTRVVVVVVVVLAIQRRQDEVKTRKYSNCYYFILAAVKRSKSVRVILKIPEFDPPVSPQ